MQVIPLLRPRHVVAVQLLQPSDYVDGRRVIAIVVAVLDAPRLVVVVVVVVVVVFEAAPNGR